MTDRKTKSRATEDIHATQSTAITASMLGLLQAEMELLRAVLPGADADVSDGTAKLPTEDEVEDSFDNMPV